jgi:transposase
MVDTKVDRTTKERRPGAGYKRPNFPTEFKRRLVEQSYESGASTALIARANDINANLLFKWRRQYLAGAYGPLSLRGRTALPPAEEMLLVPVNVMEDVPAVMPVERARDIVPASEGCCEIEFDRARLRIRGDVSPAMLKLLIRELSR